LSAYIGGNAQDNRGQWAKHDTVELVEAADMTLKQSIPILIDQGDADNFLAEQLNTQLLVDTAERVNFPMQIRFQAGYDHSYFFIATLIGEHIKFHAQHLR
jgi:S-formylglutathione hydrolase